MRSAAIGALGLALLAWTTEQATLPGTTQPPRADETVGCADDDEKHLLFGRVFPEMEQAPGYLTYDEFRGCIEYLEGRYEQRVAVDVYGESAEGRDLYIAEVTDETGDTPYEERRQVLVDVSIHGSERIGVEGGVRLIEDLAITDDPELVELLESTVLVMTFLNPDGWARGDRVRAGTRGNASGDDLNRNFPSVGYVRSAWEPLSHPESIATHERYHSPRHAGATWGVSGHGYTVATRSLNQILLMAGEQDLAEALHNQLAAQDVAARMDEATSDQPLSAAALAPGMEAPAMYGTVWETRRALNTGFLGNWLAMPEPVGLELLGFGFEHWLTENTPFTHPIVAYQVAANRAGLLATLEATQQDAEVTVDLSGPVGYLHDPALVTDRDENRYEPADEYEESLGQRSYEATRMRFFEDLSVYLGDGLVRVDPEGLEPDTPGNGEPRCPPQSRNPHCRDPLADLHAFVVAGDLVGADPERLTAYVREGGTLVLTDEALQVLPDIIGLPEAAVAGKTGLVARMDDGWGDGRFVPGWTNSDPDTRDFSHPLLVGLDRDDHFGEQLYEPVPLGFSLDEEAAPWWVVDRDGFEEAGGRTAAADPDGDVILGDVPVGDGRVVIVGGLLPQPTNAYFHPWGLGNYSVTYTGYQIFLNAIGADVQVEVD